MIHRIHHTPRHDRRGMARFFPSRTLGALALALLGGLSAAPVTAQTFLTSNPGEFTGLPVDLARCLDESDAPQEWKQKVTGFDAALHTGHPFSIRTDFWNRTNTSLNARPKPDAPLDFDNRPPDAPGGYLYGQVVVRVWTDMGEHTLRRLQAPAVKGRAAPITYFPECEARMHGRAMSHPDHYPPVQIDVVNPNMRPEVLDHLRTATKEKKWLLFHPEPLELPSVAGKPVTYGDLLKAVVARKTVDFGKQLPAAVRITVQALPANNQIANNQITVEPEPPQTEAADLKVKLADTQRRLADAEARLARTGDPSPAVPAERERDLAGRDARIMALEAEVDRLARDNAALRTAPPVAAPLVRVRLPADLRDIPPGHFEITDGACAGKAWRRLPGDEDSYEIEGCSDPGVKTVAFQGTFLQPAIIAGLVSELRPADLKVDLPLSAVSGTAWKQYDATGQRPLDRVVDIPFADVQAGRGIRLQMFPGAKPDSGLDRFCGYNFDVTVRDVIRREARTLQDDPPCDAYRISDVPLAWVGAAPRHEADPKGKPVCLDAPSDTLPWCAKLRGDRSLVAVNAGPGWAPRTVPPTDLQMDKILGGLAAAWPYADANPADPALPGRPDYRVIGARYCLADGRTCCTSSAANAPLAPRSLPALGADPHCRQNFGRALPTTVQAVFEQPPNAPAPALAYWPRFSDDPLTIAQIPQPSSRVLGKEVLAGSYPVEVKPQGALFNSADRIVLHPGVAQCDADPAKGSDFVYFQEGRLPNQNVRPGALAAVVVRGTQALTFCAEAVVRQRATGEKAESAVAELAFTTRIIPGRREVVVLVASEKAARHATEIRAGLKSWLAGAVPAAGGRPRPVVLYRVGPDGAITKVLSAEEILEEQRKPPSPVSFVERRINDIQFAGRDRQFIKMLSDVYTTIQSDYEPFLGANQPVAQSVVLIIDGEEPPLTRPSRAVLAALSHADRARLGVVTLGQGHCRDRWLPTELFSTGDDCVDAPVGGEPQTRMSDRVGSLLLRHAAR